MYKAHSETRTKQAVKILLVDDHRVVREGLAFLLKQAGEFVVTGCVGNPDEALAAIKRNPPQVVVVDIALGRTSGLDLIKTIVAEYPQVILLALSMHDESLYAERCLRAGAMGYIMKSEGHEKIIEGIHHLLAGKSYVSEAVREHIWRHAVNHPKTGVLNPEDRLTDRELAVYTLIGQGMTTQQIADGLHVSPKTVQTYRNNIKDKLGIETTAELAHRAAIWNTDRHGAKP